MADNGRGDKKFAHLLQPIRSLSDNWDIDIATELEEYLVIPPPPPPPPFFLTYQQPLAATARCPHSLYLFLFLGPALKPAVNRHLPLCLCHTSQPSTL